MLCQVPCAHLCPELVRNSPEPCLGAKPALPAAPGTLTRDKLTGLPPALMLLARALPGGRLPRVKLPLRLWCLPGGTPDMFDTMLTERAARDGKSNTAGSSPAPADSAAKPSGGAKLHVGPAASAQRGDCAAAAGLLMAMGRDLAWGRPPVRTGLAFGLTGRPVCDVLPDLPPKRKLLLLLLLLGVDCRFSRGHSLLWPPCPAWSAGACCSCTWLGWPSDPVGCSPGGAAAAPPAACCGDALLP